MNLIIDVGNSRTKYAAYQGQNLLRTHSEDGHALGALPGFVGTDAVAAVMVCSVVDLDSAACRHLDDLGCQQLWLDATTPVPLENCYHTPHTLGPDRLAAAVGAWALMPDCNLLVIDAGSCVTFDIVTSQGQYLGGNIAPGMHARFMAIDRFFPRLPLVEAEGALPEVGYDTETAIRAGVVQGLRREIEGYIRHMGELYPGLETFITGGDELGLDIHDGEHVHVVPDIVSRGLNVILSYNLGLMAQTQTTT